MLAVRGNAGWSELSIARCNASVYQTGARRIVPPVTSTLFPRTILSAMRMLGDDLHEQGNGRLKGKEEELKNRKVQRRCDSNDPVT